MAIAIARWFLNVNAKGLKGYKDEDRINDNLVDLQAGHKLHVVGIIYACNIFKNISKIAAIRKKFRSVSKR